MNFGSVILNIHNYIVISVLRRKQQLVNAKNEKLLAEQKLKNSRLNVEKLNSEVKSKQRDLSNFALNLTQNQEWVQRISAKLEQINSAKPSAKEQLFKEFEMEFRNKTTYDKDTKIVYERLDKLSDAFYSKLKTKFPKLSKNEIRLCSLIRLNMNSKSIATLQSITIASVNTSRYRLRKKLNLSENDDLDNFIQNI